MTRKFMLFMSVTFACSMLSACAKPTTPGAAGHAGLAHAPRMSLRTFQAKWPLLKAGFALALYDDGASPAKVGDRHDGGERPLCPGNVVRRRHGPDLHPRRCRRASKRSWSASSLAPRARWSWRVAEGLLPSGWGLSAA